MTTQKEMSRINKMVELIHEHGPISKVRLVMLSVISNSYYEKLKPFMEEIYPLKIRYDKISKCWSPLKSEEISYSAIMVNYRYALSAIRGMVQN